MAWTFPDNQININALITFGAAWNTVDVSSVVPAGTKVIFLQVRNTSAGSAYIANVRPYGSSSDRHTGLFIGYHNYYSVILDGSYRFEGYFGNSALNVNIVGYTNLALYSTSETDMSLGTTGSYVDCQATVGKSCAFLEMFSGYGNEAGNKFGLRINGATFDIYDPITNSNTQGGFAFAGLDANGIFEQKIANIAVDCYMWGQGDTSIVPLTSPPTKSPSQTVNWEDWDVSASVSSDAIGVFIELESVYNAGETLVNIRKKGSTDDNKTNINLYNMGGHIYGMCGLDANKVLQVYSNRTDTVYHLLGYVKDAIVYTLTADPVDYDWTPTDAWVGESLTAGSTSYAWTPFEAFVGDPYLQEEILNLGSRPRWRFTIFDADWTTGTEIPQSICDESSCDLNLEAPTDFSDLVAGEHTLKLYDTTGLYDPRSGSFLYATPLDWFGRGIRYEFGFEITPYTGNVNFRTLYEGKIFGWKRVDDASEIPVVEIYSKDFIASILNATIGTADDYGLKRPVLYGQPLIQAEDTGDTIPELNPDKSALFNVPASPDWDGTTISPGGCGTVTVEADTAARQITSYRTGAGVASGYSAQTKTADTPASSSNTCWYLDFGAGTKKAWWEGWVRFNSFPAIPAAQNTSFIRARDSGNSNYIELYLDADTRLWIKSKGGVTYKWHNTDVFAGAYRQQWIKIALGWFTDTADGVVRVYFDGSEAWKSDWNWVNQECQIIECGPKIGSTAEYWDLSWKHWYGWDAVTSPIYYRAECFGNGNIESVEQVYQDGLTITKEAPKRSKRQRKLDRKLNYKRVKFKWSCKDNWLPVPGVPWAISWSDYYNPPSGEMMFEVVANSTVGNSAIGIIEDILTTCNLDSRIGDSFTEALADIALPGPVTAPTIDKLEIDGMVCCTPGVHSVKYTFRLATGETVASPASNSITTDGTVGIISLAGVESGPPGTLGINVYLTEAGGSTYKYAGTNWTQWGDLIIGSCLDGNLGAEPPSVGTASGYGIKCNFQDTTAGEALKSITSQLLMNIWCDAGKIELDVYQGNSPGAADWTLDDSLLNIIPSDTNFEDCTPKITIDWGWYDRNSDLHYVTRNSDLIDLLGTNEDNLDLTISQPVALDSANVTLAQDLADNLLIRVGYPLDKAEVEGFFNTLPRINLWDVVSLGGIKFRVYSKSMSFDGCKIGLVRFLGET